MNANFDMEIFNLKKLNEAEGKQYYCIIISNRFTALDNIYDVDINTAWETIRQNIKVSAKESLGCYELKQISHALLKQCSKLLDQRKQAK
jgi:hypothetical protein